MGVESICNGIIITHSIIVLHVIRPLEASMSNICGVNVELCMLHHCHVTSSCMLHYIVTSLYIYYVIVCILSLHHRACYITSLHHCAYIMS